MKRRAQDRNRLDGMGGSEGCGGRPRRCPCGRRGARALRERSASTKARNDNATRPEGDGSPGNPARTREGCGWQMSWLQDSRKSQTCSRVFLQFPGAALHAGAGEAPKDPGRRHGSSVGSQQFPQLPANPVAKGGGSVLALEAHGHAVCAVRSRNQYAQIHLPALEPAALAGQFGIAPGRGETDGIQRHAPPDHVRLSARRRR